MPNPQGIAIRNSPMASRVEREWLQPTASEVVHRFDKESGKVRASAIDRYDALVLAERPAPVDPEIAAQLLADAWLARGPRDEDARLLRRLRFAGQDVDLDALVRTAAYGARAGRRAHRPRAGAGCRARSRSRRAGVARRPQRPPRSARVPRGRQRLRVGESCRSSSASPRRRASDASAKPSCSRCSRRTDGRCRSRAICAASGIARIRR